MVSANASFVGDYGLPPCGGSGLKCNLTDKVYRVVPCLPPCGGSGLKYSTLCIYLRPVAVSLLAEGVD